MQIIGLKCTELTHW